MKISANSLTKLVYVAVTAIGVASLLMPQPGWADAASEANPLKDFNTDQGGDPFSRTDQGDSFGIFDLIHRAQLGNLDSDSEGMQQNLDSAAAEYRARQRKLIQSQPTPVAPISTPQAN